MKRSEKIIAQVAEDFGLTVGDITGPSRKARICNARFYAARRIREELSLSYVLIGLALGGRDHSTIIAGLKKRGLASRRRRGPHNGIGLDVIRALPPWGLP